MSHRLAFVARACGLLLMPGMVVAACSVQSADTSGTTVINPAGGSSGSGGHGAHGGASGSAGTVSPMGGISGGSAGSAAMPDKQDCPQTQVNELISDFSSNYTGDLTAWGFGDAAP